MKASKGIICFILIVLIVFSSASVLADTDYGKVLGELGIIRGTENGYEGSKTFTRAEAAAVIVRLLGKEPQVLKGGYAQKFSDVDEHHWAFDYIMYCYKEKITLGTGEDTFSPNSTIDAPQFVTLVLRLMGYKDTKCEDALDKAVEICLFNSLVARQLEQSGDFTRNDMFYIVYRSLKTSMEDGTLFADFLADEGVITRSDARRFDIYDDFETIDDLLDKLMN